MKIEEVRPSFTVYLIASDTSKLEGIADSLGLAGYMVASFSELSAAVSEVYSNPPHFVIFDSEESKFSLKKAVKQIVTQLPETHILLVTPVAQREAMAPMLEHGVYDLILTPLASAVELTRTLDRAAERDYFMYLNERLREMPPPEPATEESGGEPPAANTHSSISLTEDFHLSYVTKLFAQKVAEEAINVFAECVSGALGSCPILFMKYIANRRVLMASVSYRLDGHDLSGLGLNFNEMSTAFRASQLRDPQDIPELGAMMKEVFNVDEYYALPVEALGEVQGVMIFMRAPPAGALARMLEDWMSVLGRALSLQESEKRLHVMCVKDPATDLLNRQNFLSRMREEVSRARRTSLPVSVAIIAVDQYGQMVSKVGQEEAQTVLKMVARIFEKHSRVNDIIGRTGADEFAIVLPHTAKQGAMIKAERLRMIIESADFSRVIKSFPNITISLGVSEYPSMARDAEELLQSADEALFQVRNQGNKTCVAKPPEGFVADFEVQSKGNL